MNCTVCGETMVEIWYGYPTWDKIELSRMEKLVLGGPKRKPYTHYCFNCQETHPFIEVSFSDE